MNLIICGSPLHVMIAERIINLYPTEEFVGIMICTVDNEKYRFYSKRLEKKCQLFFEFKYKTSILSKCVGLFKRFLFLMYLRFFYKKNISNVFLASIDIPFVQMILSYIKFSDLYTFDDGTANIFGKAYLDDSPSLIKKSLMHLLRVKYDMVSLKKLSKLHYTLYPAYKNIVAPVYGISLFDNYIFSKEITKNKSVRIMLGQPIDKKYIGREISDIINEYDINFYFPHPRERHIITNVNYINSFLTFEDFLKEELILKYESVFVYTFFSSTALHISNIDSIKVFAFKTEKLYLEYEEIYDILSENGITVINI